MTLFVMHLNTLSIHGLSCKNFHHVNGRVFRYNGLLLFFRSANNLLKGVGQIRDA